MKINPGSIYNWYRNSIRNPKYRWWMILGSLAYLLSPIDISPDIIPIVGQIDDFLVVSIMISEISQLLLDKMKNKNLSKDSFKQDDSKEEGKTVEVEAVSLD